jgi:hypothetical protein
MYLGFCVTNLGAFIVILKDIYCYFGPNPLDLSLGCRTVLNVTTSKLRGLPALAGGPQVSIAGPTTSNVGIGCWLTRGSVGGVDF